MKYLLFVLCLLSASAKAQNYQGVSIDSIMQRMASSKTVTGRSSGPAIVTGNVVGYRPQGVFIDTAVFFISNTTPSTFWHQVDHNPFPRILIRIQQPGLPIRYLKKMRHGWEPLPTYYNVWNQ